MTKIVVVSGGRVVGSVPAPELDAIIEPKAMIDALDGVFGYLDVLTPEAELLHEADCADLFPVLHAEFRGQIPERGDFHHFAAWLEREAIVNPRIGMTLYDMLPRVVTLR